MESNLFKTLNEILGKTNIEDVTSESTSFSELKDGYYLCEVVSAELKESSKHDPMVSFRFKVSEDGVAIDDDGNFLDLPKTTGRNIFINYVLKDENSVRRFVADMLKFEGDVEGEPLLGKEYFLSSDTIDDALDILVGMNIYVQVSTSEKNDGTKSTWQNLISWKRAAALELPL